MAYRDNREDRVEGEESSEERSGGGRGRFFRKPKVDPFEADKNLKIDYKDVDLLKRFLTPEGKIRPRRQTGVIARNQRKLARAIKRARHLALLSYTDQSSD
ncbi:MAG: 30S ribosomal protein S18 [Anaerolineales bacterium]|jgi:small subunit ribosomal protein S18|nr:30S ribosomal protein S18 [Anaerolineales bacterium]MBX3005036.1 30S ribosomal protein S18 [Anaerolineales bacterium]MCW5887800.1 30S ribosomal protein S18 [Anaerolineales bacterium]